jgi:hypothetical protein
MSFTLLQLMCSGPQISVLIAQLQSQASSCSSVSGVADRVFAHEDENLSIEPVLLAQCVAHVCSMQAKGASALAEHVRVSAIQAVLDLKQLLVGALELPAASALHCGGAMRHPSRCARHAV